MTELEQIERDYARRERATNWISNALLVLSVATTIPLTVFAWQYHDRVAVRAAAEDDCSLTYGVMVLDAVEPNEDGVTCIYVGV